VCSANLWGVQVSATAEVDHEVVSPPWIVDLHRSVAIVCGKLAGALCAGRLLAPGKVVSSWLGCELITEGVPSSEDAVVASQPQLAALAALSRVMEGDGSEVEAAGTTDPSTLLPGSLARCVVSVCDISREWGGLLGRVCGKESVLSEASESASLGALCGLPVP
jgi:hypothetical protein